MYLRFIHLIPLLAGILVAAMTGLGYYAEQTSYHQNMRERVQQELSVLGTELEDSLKHRLHVAWSLSHALTANPNMGQIGFETLCRGLLADIGGIRELYYIQGYTLIHAYPAPAARRISHFLVGHAQGQIGALTYLTKETRQAQVSYIKGQGHSGRLNILVPAMDAENEEPMGVVIVTADGPTMLREIGLGEPHEDLLFSLRIPATQTSPELIVTGPQQVFDSDPVVHDIQAPSGYWQLAGIPAGGWSDSPYGLYILISGTLCFFLIPASLWAVLLILSGRFEDREKYRYLVQNAKAIIIRLDLSGNITYCNEYAEAFYGYDHGELIGKPLIGTLIPERNLEGEPMKRYLSRLIKNPSAHPFNETMNVCKNGEIVWVAWANDATVARDGTTVGILCVGTDITDRKLMEEALRQREKQYRLLAENVSDIIWGLDADSRITYVSPSDETMRGFKRYDVLGRKIIEFLTPASKALYYEALNNLEQHAPTFSHSITTDMEFLCADGATVWLEVGLGNLYNEDGDKIGFQGVGRDITDRKLGEALREDVERMARHDLKTPLGAVIGLPQEIRRLSGLNTAQDQMLQTIEDAGSSMLWLINQSLDLYKMERGTYTLKRTTVDVIPMLHRIKNESQQLIRAKGISLGLEIHGSSDGNFTLQVEQELFRSMVSNLLLNALEAAPESSTIVTSLTHGEEDIITIRNQGEVPIQMRDTFFDKYSTSNSARGTGLGTYSARLIARTHGGDISVDTSVPGYTSVTVTLPRS